MVKFLQLQHTHKKLCLLAVFFYFLASVCKLRQHIVVGAESANARTLHIAELGVSLDQLRSRDGPAVGPPQDQSEDQAADQAELDDQKERVCKRTRSLLWCSIFIYKWPAKKDSTCLERMTSLKLTLRILKNITQAITESRIVLYGIDAWR